MLTSTQLQRTAARRAFQGDIPGAIQAMETAVALDPDNFHHWMWMGKLHRQSGDVAGSQRCAAEALRCMDEAPNRTISPEERTRLEVRTSILAGNRSRAETAVRRLEALRRDQVNACLAAESFSDWKEADCFAAPIYETLLELHRILADPEGMDAASSRYLASLDHALEMARNEGALPDEVAVIETRRRQADADGKTPILVE